MSNIVNIRTKKLVEVDEKGNEGNSSYGFIISDETNCDTFEGYPSIESMMDDLSPENLLSTLYNGTSCYNYEVFERTMLFRDGLKINNKFLPLNQLKPIKFD